VFLKLTGAPSQPGNRVEPERATERAGTA
jgi:hypothetical protein